MPAQMLYARRQRLVFVLTWLSYAAFYLTRKNFSVVKARLHDTVGISIDALAATDTAYLAAYALGQFVQGPLSDRFGPRRMLAFSMLGSAWCSALLGFSHVAYAFVGLFCLNGFFQAAGWSNGVKAIAAWFAPATRGKVMGAWATNYQVGGLVATALATWALTNAGWRSAFWLAALGVGAVGWAVGVYLPTCHAETAAGAQPGQPLATLMRRPTLWAFGTAYAGLKLVRYSLIFWLPFFLHERQGMSESQAGYTSLAFEVGGIVGALGLGILADRLGPGRRVLLVAPSLFACAAALSAYQSLATHGPFAAFVCLVAIGALLVGPDAMISGVCAQDLAGAQSCGAAAGFINGMGSLGAILQGILTAWVARVFGWETLFAFLTGAVLISGTVMGVLALKPKALVAPGQWAPKAAAACD